MVAFWPVSTSECNLIVMFLFLRMFLIYFLNYKGTWTNVAYLVVERLDHIIVTSIDVVIQQTFLWVVPLGTTISKS